MAIVGAVVVLLAGCAGSSGARSGEAARASPLTLPGGTFEVRSRVLGETRRINVFVPTAYGERIDGPLGVLYMPDGGLGEDFVHIAGLVQVLVSNGSMRPMLLVGIENTQRRRDLTGPTGRDEDRAIAPVVGGSGAFRAFLRDELKPAVRARYATTAESAIIGESLAGLFVVETYFVEPALFDAYIAVDPSLWWNGGELVIGAPARLSGVVPTTRPLFVATSAEPELSALADRLGAAFEARTGPGVFTRLRLDRESHATVYHPAALEGLRRLLAAE